MQELPENLQPAAFFVEGLPDAAALLNLDYQLLRSNAAFLQMSGLKRRQLEEYVTRNISAFLIMRGNLEDDDKNARHACEAKRTTHFHEVQILNANQDCFTVIQTFIPVFDKDNHVVGLIYILRDVSGEARVQTRYKDLLELERARAVELEKQVEQRTYELTVALEEVTRLSRTDPLTGLLNRRAFTEHAAQMFDLALRNDRGFAIVMCDLDHFKELNDTYGHQAGDSVLIATAKALQSVVRKTDKIGRYGGEEFIILLTDAEKTMVPEICERYRHAIRDLRVIEIVPGFASGLQTISIGAAMFPEHSGSLESLIGCADNALYSAKESGRDRVVVYSTQLQYKKEKQDKEHAGGILVVDQNSARAKAMCALLAHDYYGMVATSFDNAREACSERTWDVLIVHQNLGDASGYEFFAEAFSFVPDAVRILLVDKEEDIAQLPRVSSLRIDACLKTDETNRLLATTVVETLKRRSYSRDWIMKAVRTKNKISEQGIHELDALIENKAIDFVFQPLLSFHEKRIVAYEALCRPQGNLIRQPKILFDVAVHAGAVWKLSRLIRERVATYVESMPANTLLFMNLHPADLDDPQLLEGECHFKQCYNRMVFEITERASIPDFGRSRANIRKLKQMGYRFAVDDLGAGYASLNSIALLEPDFIKIDMMLVRGIRANSLQARLVRRIVDFANDANIKVIAEGIETIEEQQTLVELGCHWIQGYYIGRPQKHFVTDEASQPAVPYLQ